ncbi:hypothetical protein V6N12_031525 [Hibiscus sabdariffa]|uniref:Uncharacterized protein n=1 Tax=Hibiscus sabdariffa TaxID=183260 RepID=A0ABR2CR83_9ROSI
MEKPKKEEEKKPKTSAQQRPASSRKYLKANILQLNSCKKRGRFSCPITAGSQIHVRNASAISLELGGQLIPAQRYLEATCPLYK